MGGKRTKERKRGGPDSPSTSCSAYASAPASRGCRSCRHVQRGLISDPALHEYECLSRRCVLARECFCLRPHPRRRPAPGTLPAATELPGFPLGGSWDGTDKPGLSPQSRRRQGPGTFPNVPCCPLPAEPPRVEPWRRRDLAGMLRALRLALGGHWDPLPQPQAQGQSQVSL